jgi:hypothetical protein
VTVCDEVDGQLDTVTGSKSEAGSQLVGMNGSVKSDDPADDGDMVEAVTELGMDDGTSPYD